MSEDSSLNARDIWAPPTLDDTQLAEIRGVTGCTYPGREAERLDLSVPAIIKTQRGDDARAMTMNISRFGIGLVMRGIPTVQEGQEIVVSMSSDTRTYRYKADIKWTRYLLEKNLTRIGARFTGRVEDDEV